MRKESLPSCNPEPLPPELLQLVVLCEKLAHQYQHDDLAHDRYHRKRVLNLSLQIRRELPDHERPNLHVTIPAAILHDVVNYPKDHTNRHLAAEHSAQLASKLLKESTFPNKFIPEVQDSIASHSYSGRQTPQIASAKVLQDADRLDSLGAIGLYRMTVVGASLNSNLYHDQDPFCLNRGRDSQKYILDHLVERQLEIPAKMQTEPGKRMATQRVKFLHRFQECLIDEIGNTQVEIICSSERPHLSDPI